MKLVAWLYLPADVVGWLAWVDFFRENDQRPWFDFIVEFLVFDVAPSSLRDLWITIQMHYNNAKNYYIFSYSLSLQFTTMILKIRSPPHIFSSSRATMEIIQPTTAQYRRGEDKQ